MMEIRVPLEYAFVKCDLISLLNIFARKGRYVNHNFFYRDDPFFKDDMHTDMNEKLGINKKPKRERFLGLYIEL